MDRLTDKLLSWLPEGDIEPQALEQAQALSRLPFVNRLALMPDCHLGKGATVGSVIATESAIIPAAVGVDIGCGMIAVETNLVAGDLPDSLDALRGTIEDTIPTGIGERGVNQTIERSVVDRMQDPNVDLLQRANDMGMYAVDSRWVAQVGTLGGGNHFIEVCLDERDTVWLVLHSGSRGIGNKLATRHIRVAKDLAERLNRRTQDPDMAHFEEGQGDFTQYIMDLRWAQDFALVNREEMMDRALRALKAAVRKAKQVSRVNCHHNFTQRETHFGRDMWITRKGAIQMKRGQLGVIPGSMGTRSYIVSGLGEAESMESAPHGAGRRMSRKQASKTFTMESLEESMRGINARLRPAILDEHPLSYKDIDVVMEQSKELVEVKHTLRQVLNVKGD